MDVERPQVLVVQHEDAVPVRLLGDWLVEEGCDLVTVRPYRDEPVPGAADLLAHDAVVVLGGTMDAWDDDGHPWFPATRALVRDAAETGTPLLGICLGHQLAVQAFGGEVGRNPQGRTAAVVPVGWAAEVSADPLLGDVAGPHAVAVHHNADVARRLPAVCTVLATAPDGTAQAVRLAGTVWGVQCHPEADAALVRRWERLGSEGKAASEHDERVVDEVADRASELLDTWRPLASGLARLARATSRRRASVTR